MNRLCTNNLVLSTYLKSSHSILCVVFVMSHGFDSSVSGLSVTLVNIIKCILYTVANDTERRFLFTGLLVL